MLTFVLRKMLNNRWLVLCLLIGSIIVIALVSCIPVYTTGLLQRMLTKDLEITQADTATYPGDYKIDAKFSYQYEDKERADIFRTFNEKITTVLSKQIKLPVVAETRQISLLMMKTVPVVQRESRPMQRSLKISTLYGIENHIKILNGRIFSNTRVNGVNEVIVTEKSMQDYGFLLGETYELTPPNGNSSYKVKIVGVFSVKDQTDPYWGQKLEEYVNCFFMDYSLFYKEFVDTSSLLINEASWKYAFDYHKIELKDLATLTGTYESQCRWFDHYLGTAEFSFTVYPILQQYDARQKQLSATLWVLIVPVLIVLAFYIFMVSQLIIKNEENEIAVLKSRGASGFHIFKTYLLESLILSGIAVIVGPPIGLFLCRIIGSANGFLEFVQRTTLPISLSWKAYLYSIAALLLFMGTMLIPAIASSKTTIVIQKQKNARSQQPPFWRKYFLDVIILALAIAGIYNFNSLQKTVNLTGTSSTELGISPLLFLTSTFFILGIGLLFLRVFPYIIRFIFWVGRNVWSPVFYVSFIQVGRSARQEQFLMLFIMFTLSIGIFNANAARTVNRNMEDRINYNVGADITIKAVWPSNKQVSSIQSTEESDTSQQSEVPIIYSEPPFSQYTNLAGVELATKVLSKKDTSALYNGAWVDGLSFMAIIPDEFGKVAWFRNDLLPSHWYNYLNVMSKSRRAFLVSKNFKTEKKAKLGDTIYVKWGNQGMVEGIISGFVDYWPTYNPSTIVDKYGGKANQYLVVANLSYVQQSTTLEPYQVWLKEKKGATDAQVYNDIAKKNIGVEEISSSKQQITKNKNDPMLQGTNGMLTMGFIITMIISALGFLIYWILSIQRRVLQFGIFRAMGLSMKKVIGMILCEQVLISGTAIFMGIIIGGITSDLFVPRLQIAESAAAMIPPFKITAYGGDYIKIYAITAAMLLVGFLVLRSLIMRIKIDQALKLGED